MKQTTIFFLLIFCTPFSLNASYVEAMKKRADSATFHAMLFCKARNGKISEDKLMTLSDKYLIKNFTISEQKTLGKTHWDAVNFLAGKLKPHCSLSKYKNDPKFDETIKLFTEILLYDY